MTTKMKLFNSKVQYPGNISSNFSKGNQLKKLKNNFWYKVDYLGYEAASEFATSKLLKNSNIRFVEYKLCEEQFRNTELVCCASEDFLEDGQSIITLNKLFKNNLGVDISIKCAKLPVKDAISWVVTEVENMTGLSDFGLYLSNMLALDAVILNEDRHFRNIAVLKTVEGFDYCPIFDNGAAFLSDIMSYPKGDISRDNLEQYITSTEVKPFGHTFDEQLDACEALYGSSIKFKCQDLALLCQDNILKYYDEEVLKRIDFVFRESKRKYSYLFK